MWFTWAGTPGTGPVFAWRRPRRMVTYLNSLLQSECVPWNQNSIDLWPNQANPICVKIKDQYVRSLGLHGTKLFMWRVRMVITANHCRYLESLIWVQITSIYYLYPSCPSLQTCSEHFRKSWTCPNPWATASTLTWNGFFLFFSLFKHGFSQLEFERWGEMWCSRAALE